MTPRGGIDVGPLLAREGDYYGPPVNVASRLAQLAVPDEILVTANVRSDPTSSDLEFAPAGRRLLIAGGERGLRSLRLVTLGLGERLAPVDGEVVED